MVQLTFVWLPIFFIFGIILWIKAQSLNYMIAQRTLDRCLLPQIEQRCQTMSQLSKANHTIKVISNALAAAQAMKLVTIAIPVVGQITAGLSTMTLEAAKDYVEVLAKSQDLLILKERASSLMLFKCGIPTQGLASLRFSRRPNFQSTMAQTPAPLTLDSPRSELTMKVWSWALRYESFATCQPPPALQQSSDNEPLDGETYQVVFKNLHPKTERQARQLLKPSFLSQWL